MTAQASPFRISGDVPRVGASGPMVTVVALVVIVVAVAGSVSLRIQGPVSPIAVSRSLPALLAAVGLLVVVAAADLAPDERRAWRMMGAAFFAAAASQLGRSFVLDTVDTGVGLIALDGFSVLFYLLMAGGLVSLPSISATRWGNIRLGMDVAAGLAAAATLLHEFRPEAASAGLAAPVLHLVLAGAMLLAGLRRSLYALDSRLAIALLGLMPVLAITRLAPTGGPSWSTSLWMMTAACLASAAWLLTVPQTVLPVAMARPPRRRLVFPYSLVAVLLVVFMSRVLGGADLSGGLLAWGTVIVVAAIVGRSVAATFENKRIMEVERDQLLASLSHEIRTPLTAVSGFADVLHASWESLAPSERLEMVGYIRDEAGSVASIVCDMAALARHELDAVDVKVERVDGKELVAEAIRLVFDLSAPIPVKAEVEPYVAVLGDRSRMVQMLRSLLENAKQYGRGRILVVVSREKNGRLIEVHDDGPGVDPRYTKTIWQRFNRGENELNGVVLGSGLGLSVVRSLARAHGGDAYYRRSDRLGGACFWVELPYDADRAEAESGRSAVSTDA